MTDMQLKEGDLVVFRSRIDCQTVTSVEYDEDGEIKSLYVTDGFKTRLLKWEDRADDPVIELPVSLGDVLKELHSIHDALQYEYQHAEVGLVVEEREQVFGVPAWKWEIEYEIRDQSDTEDDPSLDFVLDWEDGEDDIKKLANDLMENAVNNFTLI